MDISKPILVTGATGSIGAVLTNRLIASGQCMRLVVRSPDKAAIFRNKANVEIIAGDLEHPASLRGCAEGCSLVYHLAAKLPTTDWVESYAINVNGTRAIANEAVRAGVDRLIYASTIGVYGICKQELITEETPWSEFNQPYFKTKQEAERIALQAAGRIPVTIARVGEVVGPGQFTWTIDIIQKLNRGILQPPLEWESGFLNPVYIDNLVDALVLMGTHPAASGQVFNVVDGTPVLVNDYFRRLAQMAGKRLVPLPFIVLKAAGTLLRGYELMRDMDSTIMPGSLTYLLRKGKIYPDKLKTLLGWAPAISLEEAYCRTEQWLRQEEY